MKQLFLLAFFIISIQHLFAQNFAWVQSWGGSSTDDITSVVTDGNGNLFVAGFFRHPMDADPGSSILNLSSKGERDIYISKFNASGTLLWTKQLAGPGDEITRTATIDQAGNIYVTGFYTGLVDFDPGPGIFNLYNDGVQHAYVCKLDNDGNFIWAKEFDGGASRPDCITVDANQQVYIAGNFSAITDFDPGPEVYNLDANNREDMFVCKLDEDGELIWAKQIAENGDTISIIAQSIAVDIQGNIYMSGNFNGTVDFDPGTAVFNLSSAVPFPETGYLKDVFVSKLDTDGNFIWAGKIAGEGNTFSTEIAVDENGYIYTTGYFSQTVDFDPGPALFEITPLGTEQNGYICKFDPDGDLVWAKSLAGTSRIILGEVIIVQNEIYTTGTFNGTIDFDPGITTHTMTATGGYDAFVCKLDLDGNFIWSQKSDGVTDESVYAMAVDPVTKNVFVAGIFDGTADFDPSAESWEVVAKGDWDVFLYKLGECMPNNGITEIKETCNQYLWPENGGLYTVSGTYGHILTSSNGCDSIVKLDLTLWNYENVISINGQYLNANSSASIDEYKWVNCATFAVVGTEETYLLTTNGSYALISTSGNCVDTSNCINVTNLGLDELEAAGLVLYPNPVSDHLVFQSSNALQPFEIEITSVNGQLAGKGTYFSGDKITTEKWPAGIYLVKIISNEKSYITRIVKN